jgi:anti-anti-sigma factor
MSAFATLRPRDWRLCSFVSWHFSRAWRITFTSSLSMQQQITVENTNHVTFVRLGGTVLGESSEVGLAKLLDETSQAQVIVNLSGVQLLRSTEVGTLIKAQRAAKSRSGQLRLCCLSATVTQLLSKLRLDKSFDIYKTEEAAVASLHAGAPPHRMAS